jgi:hypothetical protein
LQIVTTFGEVSGLHCNLSKSSVSPIRCREEEVQISTEVLNCPVKPFPVKYLGLPLSPVRLTKADLQPLVDKIARHVPTWKASLLERSGRLILIDSTIAASPIYHMLCLDLPQWFFDYVNRLECGFFWSAAMQARRGQCAVAWDMVCSPKLLGGLGLKNLKLLNWALRMRWKWMELADDAKPWNGLEFDIPDVANNLFQAATLCVLGNGLKLKFWTDRWLVNFSIADLAPNLFKFVKPKRRADTVAVALENHVWTTAMTGIPSVPAIAEFVELWDRLREVQLTEGTADEVQWRLTASGKYSARSAYQLFFMGREEVPAMRELWTSGAPLKHKLHMWLALKDRLWTADRLQERGLRHPAQCSLCCQEPETIEHLTVQCSFSRQVWFQLLAPYNLQHLAPSANSTVAFWWQTLAAAVPKSGRKELNTFVVLVARSLWLERNARVFDRAAVMPAELCRRIKEEFKLWATARLWSSGSDRGIT